MINTLQKSTVFTFGLAIVLLLSACPGSLFMSNNQTMSNLKTGEKFKSSMQYNLVGLTGTGTVEVSYSQYDPTSKTNIVVTQSLTLPCIIGGHEVQVEKVGQGYGDSLADTISYVKCGYQEAAYLNIVNRSDSDVEFCFIPVTFMFIREYNYSTDFNPNLRRYPMILYNSVPVYYHLYPEKNKHWNETMFLDGYPIVFTKPTATMTINEIMALYRREYSGGEAVLRLYCKPNTKSGKAWYRLTEIDTEDTKYVAQQYKYYGKIAKNSSLDADLHYPILSLNTMETEVSIDANTPKTYSSTLHTFY